MCDKSNEVIFEEDRLEFYNDIMSIRKDHSEDRQFEYYADAAKYISELV